MGLKDIVEYDELKIVVIYISLLIYFITYKNDTSTYLYNKKNAILCHVPILPILYFC